LIYKDRYGAGYSAAGEVTHTVLWVWRLVNWYTTANVSLELIASASSPTKLCANRHGVVPQKNGIFSFIVIIIIITIVIIR